MNMTFCNRVAVLTLMMVFAGYAHAGVLEETCSLVYKKLRSGPYENLTKSIESFTDEDKPYRGCVIRRAGNTKNMTNAQRPAISLEGLFGDSLPACPNGKLPADLPPDLLNKDGWCADKMADEPNGISYRALNKGVFCAVEGHWDGGDDSDPKYLPSPRSEVIVKCANR